jgi:hypothetical protein
VTIRQGEAYLRAELKVRIQSPPAASPMRTFEIDSLPDSPKDLRLLLSAQ